MKKWWGNSKAKGVGFTIVELLIVVTVIGILSLIIVVSYGAVVNNAHNSSVKDNMVKLSDQVKLLALDTNSIPSGGATDVPTGDSTLFPDIDFEAQQDSYDDSVSNLYYCAGQIGGVLQFAIIAQSRSGTPFTYMSEGGFNGSPTVDLDATTGAAVCEAAGFTPPFTWSYGYNPSASPAWFDWATKS